MSSKFICCCIPKGLRLSLYCYPMDADEAFVGAVHLIHDLSLSEPERSESIEKDHEEACC